MWVALAIMTTESVTSLLPVASELVRISRAWHKMSETTHEYDSDGETEPAERLVPMRHALWGLFASALLGTLIIRTVFGADGIKAWATLIGFLLAAFLSFLGCVASFEFSFLVFNEWTAECVHLARRI